MEMASSRPAGRVRSCCQRARHRATVSCPRFLPFPSCPILACIHHHQGIGQGICPSRSSSSSPNCYIATGAALSSSSSSSGVPQFVARFPPADLSLYIFSTFVRSFAQVLHLLSFCSCFFFLYIVREFHFSSWELVLQF